VLESGRRSTVDGAQGGPAVSVVMPSSTWPRIAWVGVLACPCHLGMKKCTFEQHGRAPCRPDTRQVDAAVHGGGSFSEFRRLKRLKLAETDAFCLWGRSPSPEEEGLLCQEDDTARGAASGHEAAPSAAPQRSPALAALDGEELALFMCAEATASLLESNAQVAQVYR
jgi:hypothetical protein